MGRVNLEIKKFDEYTKEEQMEILFHWWHYYGKLPLSFDEMDKFKKLMEEDMNFIKNVALVSWAKSSASQDLVRAMRGDLPSFKESINELAKSKEFKEVEELLETTFIEEVVGTYNNPEEAVPMSEEQFFAGLAEILGSDVSNLNVVNVVFNDLDESSVITSEKVHEIYRECLLKEEELKNGKPNVDFTIGEGIMCTSVFSSERLAERKEQILSMIDELPDIDNGPSFFKLCCDKHGRQWTGEHSIMDLLVQLGIAVEAVMYPLPREMWPLVGGVPLVLRVREKDKDGFRTHNPIEFKKVKEELNNGTYRKNAFN